MKKLLFLFILNCFVASASDIPNYYLGSGNEISIAINPTDPYNVVVGANLKQLWYTTDMGNTWISSSISSQNGVWGDPALEFDAKGNVYYAHLSNSEFWLDRIVIQRSTDGGKSWDMDKGIGYNGVTQHDKEWIVADILPESPRFGNLYTTWTEFDLYGSEDPGDSTRILFSSSESSGEFWSEPIVISDVSGNCIDLDETVEGAVPCTGPNGEIYVSWSGPLGIMFDKSLDGGFSFGKDIFVTDQPGGWTYDIPNYKRCNGLPVTACDISNSQYKGRIYILYSAQVSSINTNVYLTMSDDGGETWSQPKDISDAYGDSHQFMAWMDVDPITGYIYAAYYDNRNYEDNSKSDIYLSVSKDGGETFQVMKINALPIVPNSEYFLGDYLGIDSYDGNVWIAWTYRSNISSPSAIAAFLSDKCYSVEEDAETHKVKVSPNPSEEVSNIEFTLESNAHVSLYIESLDGRLADTAIDKEMSAGQHSFTYETGKLSSGVYFYRLDIGSQTIRKRCCIIK
jgi:hypothetical protein